MILPIYAFGQPVLRQVAQPINPDYPGLKQLLDDMLETMNKSEGVGIAAPQVGLSIRIFVMDTLQIKDKKNEPVEGKMKQIFINPKVISETGAKWSFEEGCLSIPYVRGEVERPYEVTLSYQDEAFNTYEKTFTGINARVIQHEYDHLEGILFTDLLKPLKKKLVKNALERIRIGNVDTDYKMKFVR